MIAILKNLSKKNLKILSDVRHFLPVKFEIRQKLLQRFKITYFFLPEVTRAKMPYLITGKNVGVLIS